jgi:leucyl aminopeptidase
MDLLAKKIDDASKHATDCAVVPVFARKQLSAAARQLDNASGGLIKTALANGDIEGKIGQTLTLHMLKKSPVKRILLIGCGNTSKMTEKEARQIVTATVAALQSSKGREATVFLEELHSKQVSTARVSAMLARQTTVASYRYRETLSKPRSPANIKKLYVSTGSEVTTRACGNALKRGQRIGTGINTARELGNLPGNICTPTYLASEARKLGRRSKLLTTSVLEEEQMKKLGMGALLSVSAGSVEPAKLIVMNYKGGAKSSKPYVLVGKGITFDSGGISLKPGAKMDEMKFDMCGAASVFGAMEAVVSMQLPINIVAIVAAAENMPSSTASKPGDVVTSMSGQTIEILNTDAEGRLVLCDALTYAEKFKPAAVIDIATLTGACVVALGAHATGMYANQDKLAEQLLNAGVASHDRAWRMPLWDDYQKQINTPFADMANVGGAGGGSITAACFLARYAKKYHWAHLDIAGTAWNSAPKAATGRPVGLLVQYLMDRAGIENL